MRTSNRGNDPNDPARESGYHRGAPAGEHPPGDNVESLRGVIRQLETQNRELREADSAKNDFLAALSHELRIPLTPVMALLSSMEHDEALPQETRAELARMRSNLQLESKLIDDLLDVNRSVLGKEQLRLSRVDMHAIVRRALEIVRIRAKQKKIELWIQFSAGNPMVSGDSRRLLQVVWNLLNNAVDFTPPEGDVTVSSRNDGENVLVEVIDSGGVIPSEDLERIFAPFEPANKRMECVGCFGLGLPLSRRIIQLHGGSLRAESDDTGPGASFILELPCASETDTSAPEPIRFAPAKVRVLLVEDDPFTATTFEKLLKLRGNEVVVAYNMVEAMALATKEKFDLLISDLGLPDGSGHDLMRYFAGTRDSTGIAVSGYGLDSDIEQSLQAGFSEHLTKPVAFEELEAAVGRVLGGMPVEMSR